MREEFEQNQVSRTVWPWQTKNSLEILPKPSLIASLFALTVALSIAGLMFYLDHGIMAVVIVGISSFIFCSTLFFPGVYRFIENQFQKLSHFVGLLLTWLLLVPVFYICFTLGRGVQKITGRDPMQRKLHGQQKSYWKIRNEPVEIDQYRRQF